MRSTESGFSTVVYLAAAQERIITATLLSRQASPDHVAVAYLCGVAVECLFHAFRMHYEAEDVGRHDLRLQAEPAQFYDGMTRAQRIATTGFVADLASRWQNNHRYRSAEALREWMVRNRLHIIEGSKSVHGDVVAHNVDRMIECATGIIHTGILRWDILSKT